MEVFDIPAQTWEDFAKTIDLVRLSEQKGDKAVSVRTFEFRGYLYMSYGALYCPTTATQASTLYAYRLLPASLFDGFTTTIYHDPGAIERGERQRGCLRGLIVVVQGKRMVCSDRVHFIQSLPTSKPPTLEEAQKHDTISRCYGWRSFEAKGITPSWHIYKGFPLVHYVNPARELDMYVLYWKAGKHLQEMRFEGELELDSVSIAAVAAQPAQGIEQMSLF